MHDAAGAGAFGFPATIPKIKIRLMFDRTAPASNFADDWNEPPTVPMLVAIRSEDGKGGRQCEVQGAAVSRCLDG
jgi:hypothetical protein